MTKIVSTPIPIESWHHNWIKNVLNQLKKTKYEYLLWYYYHINQLLYKNLIYLCHSYNFMTTLACVDTGKKRIISNIGK